MAEPKIYVSPSDQVGNAYAYGNTNEAVQCRRIADALEVALKRCGFQVRNNKTDSMAVRCEESDAWGAALHVAIHTNAYNKSVTGTRLFCYSTAGEGYKACKAVFAALAPLTPGTSENISANPGLYETRVPAAPTVYIEVDFHDVAAVAKWIIENTEAIGEAIAKGICTHYGKTYVEPKQPLKLVDGNTLYTVQLITETSKKDEAVAQLEKALEAGFKNATLVATTRSALI